MEKRSALVVMRFGVSNKKRKYGENSLLKILSAFFSYWVKALA